MPGQPSIWYKEWDIYKLISVAWHAYFSWPRADIGDMDCIILSSSVKIEDLIQNE